MNILLMKKYYHQINNKYEQAKFTYSLLGKAFEKQIKTIEDQGQKKVEALKDLKPKNKQNQSKVNLIINQGQQLYLMILLKEKA